MQNMVVLLLGYALVQSAQYMLLNRIEFAGKKCYPISVSILYIDYVAAKGWLVKLYCRSNYCYFWVPFLIVIWSCSNFVQDTEKFVAHQLFFKNSFFGQNWSKLEEMPECLRLETLCYNAYKFIDIYYKRFS